MAAGRGATVIGTASERNHEFLRSLGATPTTYGAGLPERVAALAPDGVHAVLDTVGSGSLDDLIVIAGDAVYSMYDTYSEKTAVYHVIVMGNGILTVKRGANTVRRQLEDADLVDLADQLLAPRAETGNGDWMRGTIATAGHTVPFVLAMPRELWANVLGTFSQLQHEVAPEEK